MKMSSNREMTCGPKKVSIGIGTGKNRILESYNPRSTWKMSFKFVEFTITRISTYFEKFGGPIQYLTFSCQDS